MCWFDAINAYLKRCTADFQDVFKNIKMSVTVSGLWRTWTFLSKKQSRYQEGGHAVRWGHSRREQAMAEDCADRPHLSSEPLKPTNLFDSHKKKRKASKVYENRICQGFNDKSQICAKWQDLSLIMGKSQKIWSRTDNSKYNHKSSMRTRVL